ncbi:putative leucine aminopeptidase 2 [Amniculicola lignicola CBS 123094]|uniref:Peptide hydrolase n=1 Tax=Amniculicola lignicola CBS 123094 TaxID=1392246 RepID=A0A6A5WNP8_9PLEO|nr:putative leucine aminopeptidase 2 [Amniculicola lignicola CBS 123094]
MKATLILAAIAALSSAAVIDPRGKKDDHKPHKPNPPPHHYRPKPKLPPHYHPKPPWHHDDDKCKKKPLVSSKELQKTVTADDLLKGSKALESFAYSTAERNRLMGSIGHNKTVDYLKKELEKLGGYYDIKLEPFSSLTSIVKGNLSINGVPEDPYGIYDYSPAGDVTAPLKVVANYGCNAADYPDLTGFIALVARGGCDFGLKSALAGAHNAVGALIYNNIPDGAASGTLVAPPRPEGPYVPTIGILQARGLGFAAAIGGGDTVTANINVYSSVIDTSYTNNVIATTKCGNKDTVLMLGAHSDSVIAGPGINDDGSGVIGILNIAKNLAKYKVNNAVRFGWWSGEEEGELGSYYYLEHASAEELAGIRAYLNFDMIASPNFYHAIYDGDGSAFNKTGPTGSAEIEKLFEDFFKSKGENSTATAFDGRSDYAPFIEAGIPAGGTFTGAEYLKTTDEVAQFGGVAGVAYDVNYHGPGDNVANLAMGAFVLHTKAIAASVATYATSFKSLPPKGPVAIPTRKRGLGDKMAPTRTERRTRRGRKVKPAY